jgi:hypothetical protein
MRCLQVVAVGAVVLASVSLALAAGEKIEVPVDGAGIVKIKPVCMGEESALEVEVELKGAVAMADCTATVEALGVSEDLDDFYTDDEGEGETKGEVNVVPTVDEDVAVTVTIVCTAADGTQTTYTVEGTVVFEKSCDDEEEEEEEYFD